MAIFLVALGYRSLCFSVIGGHPLYRYPIVDAGQHDAWARRIIAGDWLGHGPDDVFKPPLYPYFLAGLYRVFGRRIELIQWSQFILGSVSCVFLSIIGSRLLGRKTGRIAGLLSAVYGPYVFFELQLLTTTLSIFLNLTAVLLLIPPENKPGHGRLALAGVVFGLSTGVRPDVIIPALLVLSYLLLENRRMPWRKLATGALCVTAGAASVLVPIAARNYHLVRQIIPVSSNAGINFYVGNSAGADGVTAVPVGLRWDAMVARVPQEILEKPATAGRWWVRASLQEIRADPASALLRLGRKALAFFNRREFRNNICYHFMQNVSWPFRLSPLQFATILPLALCGLVYMGHSGGNREHRTFILCFLWVVGYWLVGIAFFVTARFRLPAVPFLVLPAAWVIIQIQAAIRARQHKSLLGYASVMLIIGVICWPMWFGSPQRGWVRDNVNLGNSLIEAGDLSGARKAFDQALAHEPNDPDAHFLLGRMLLPRDPAGALEHFEAARRWIADSPSLLLATSQAYLQIGELSQSRQTLQKLLDLSEKINLWPKRDAWATAHILIAKIEPLQAKDHWDKAWSIDPRTTAEAAFLQSRELPRVLKTFQAEVLQKPWDWYSQANLGMALLELGHADEAVEPFRRAAQLAPEREGIQFQLARALLQMGEKEETLDILDRLTRELPPCVLRDQVDAMLKHIRDGK